MKWKETYKIQLLGLGDYLDIDNKKEKEHKHETRVFGLGNLVDGNEIEKMMNSVEENYK